MARRKRPKLIVIKFNEQGGRCAYCGKPMEWSDVTQDHVVPVCRGGPTTPWNIVAACKTCNMHKGSLSLIDFLHALTKGKPEQHDLFNHPALKLDMDGGL